MKKALALILALVMVVGMAGCGSSKLNEQEFSKKLKEKSEQVGLKDISYSITKSSYEGYTLYHYNLTCSNFADYSYSQMLKIAKELESIYAGDEIVFLKTISSNGNNYELFTSTNTIKLNGKEVYDDYWNSESHKSATQTSDNSSTSGGDAQNAETCQSCNRSFTDATNKNYIRHTNMCKNCYQNFCWATGKTPTDYDK